MTETELEQAIAEGLQELVIRLVEQGEDADVVAELIVSISLRLWPELNDLYGPYDEDDHH